MSVQAPPCPTGLGLPDADAAAAELASLRRRFGHVDTWLSEGTQPEIALDRLAAQAWREGNAPESVRFLKLAVSLAPGLPRLWANLAAALNAAGCDDLAGACLETSLILDRNQPQVWLYLAALRAAAGDVGGAEPAYQAALDLAPELADAWFGLAQVRHQQRRFEDTIRCLEACIRYGGGNAEVHGHLGQVRYQIGAFSEAGEAFSQAVALAPEVTHFRHMLGLVQLLTELIGGAPVAQAEAIYRDAAGSAAHGPAEVLRTAFGLLNGFGHRDAAMCLGRVCRDRAPDDPAARYMLEAAAGAALTQAPVDYIVDHFNAFADSFDAQLVNVLGYRVPEALCALLGTVLPADQLDRRLTVVDAGCGTGLAGPLLRPWAQTLTGLDLAPAMLAHAADRGVYDRLIETEVTVWLAAHPGSADLIVAADLLIYIGDIRPLFAAAASALHPGGRLALSIETCRDEDFRLLPSGRFAQSPDYVRRTADEAGLTVALEQASELRLEANRPVAGRLFLLRRNI